MATRSPSSRSSSGRRATTGVPSNAVSVQVRLLAAFGVLMVALLAGVFFTGDRTATPKLGIDLQGGTRVTLTPTGDASDQQLQQARDVLLNRVNGMGVSGSEVQIDGSNLVITVPGQDSDGARTLGTTAQMLVRPVQQPLGPHSVPAEEDKQPSVTPERGETPAETRAREVEALRAFRQGPDTVDRDGHSQPATLEDRYAALATNAKTMSCQAPDRFAGADDPALPLLACDNDGQIYVLEPAPEVVPGDPGAGRLGGSNINSSTVGAGVNQQGEQAVNFTFVDAGSAAWARVTGENVGRQVAMVLDSTVVSAPSIRTAITNGATEISGSFTMQSAQDLADVLRYGALPLSFAAEDGTPGGKVETIPASLGFASLKAGLIAALVGLIAVAVYSTIFYRLFGLLTVGILGVALGMSYLSLVLLGRWIGYTLDLPGIAGMIIGMGMTADSFVVFFERIKDEIREGRTFRSAVPRGWKSARRTIWTGNAVSLIAAVVLYVLAVGEVQGFAFTLGLTTIFDLLTVFLVTAPLVLLLSRSRAMSRPSLTGLGGVAEAGERERREHAAAEAIPTDRSSSAPEEKR